MNVAAETHRDPIEQYLLTQVKLSVRQLERVKALTQLWQGTLPIVAWKLGLIESATLAILFNLPSD